MKQLLFALVLTMFISCNSDEETDFVAKNELEITAYIEKNNLQAEKSNSGLYYVIDEEGSGVRPSASSEVTVAYKGYYSNGKVFDQSKEEGISFPLQGVIRGWTEGIPYFKEGGRGMLLVPAHLGYGNRDTRGIPGGSVLIFDIHLITVK
ncbi:FKBP-type peptidyl-prolyl cis-trans isomerase FkpA [Arenibacter antarcticus]|uniref:Peptidyl-prolyl cis-trans isomerase n=1 Tax=Arenibacter antarcticus TaxID=2040469 RepID=A0ABW5V9G6_9FLAO|nr:FKBP-type peptidyl-prolyl cis-trans isomerase [Arenibacter sp. H213]MCM4167973.1 peptidylprolyl isomerase [Arenibacter sp. H213]